MNKFILTLIVFLTACTSINKKIFLQKEWIKDTQGFYILINQFAHNIEKIWGLNEILLVNSKDFIKYNDNYKTRSHINFHTGNIVIESISNKHVIKNLRQAIIEILLLKNPSQINFYCNKKNILKKQAPLLYGQVLDHNGQPIFYKKSAFIFANYLIKKSLNHRISKNGIIWFINIPMVANHVDKRARKYLYLVKKASNKYKIDASLIFSIMQTESSFNPYAVSNSDALGLMQVIRHSAGLDVFRLQGKWGKPGRRYLFNPKNNIDVGVAYLALLQYNYLSGIDNPISRRYAVITAYNSGAGSVLRIFSDDKDIALKKINSLSPEQVYKKLIFYHPSVETRKYLYKVTYLLNKYYQSFF